MDPSQPISRPPSSPSDASENETSLSEVLNTQLSLAKDIQTMLRGPASADLDPRAYKDLVGAASAIVGMAHRTQEAVRTIETYEAFASTVMEFLRVRGDQIGEDLVARLKEVAEDMGTADAFRKASKLVS